MSHGRNDSDNDNVCDHDHDHDDRHDGVTAGVGTNALSRDPNLWKAISKAKPKRKITARPLFGAPIAIAQTTDSIATQNPEEDGQKRDLSETETETETESEFEMELELELELELGFELEMKMQRRRRRKAILRLTVFAENYNLRVNKVNCRQWPRHGARGRDRDQS
ncbi:GL18082 [Drosophila persimilis]|uniref:GL18082 n=1 Tax=Drosophila persimilis TaxID=7234 RepID=B4HDL4_DROPE|nr:GL18082 [Drosophila persimilis]